MSDKSRENLSFRESFALELEFIAKRRGAMSLLDENGVIEEKKTPLEVIPSDTIQSVTASTMGRKQIDTAEEELGVPITEADAFGLTGIAMSGGGIRSASICMGVMQGLDSLSKGGNAGVLNKIDYISAVSGGNYMATSISAALKQHFDRDQTHYGPHFPFESKTDSQETPETQHIRHHARFLAPHGAKDYVLDALVVVRGILSNIVKFSGVLFFLSAFFLIFKSNLNDLETPLFFNCKWLGLYIHQSFQWFPISFILVCCILFYVFLVPIAETFSKKEIFLFPESVSFKKWKSKVSKGRIYVLFVSIIPTIVLLLVVSVFIEMQPFALKYFSPSGGFYAEGGLYSQFTKLFPSITTSFSVGSLIALIGTIATFANKLVAFIKSAKASTGRNVILSRFFAKAVLLVLGLSIPVLLWVCWLLITNAGLQLASCTNSQTHCLKLLAYIPETSLLSKAALLYLLISLVFLAISFGLYRPNDNSLHRLYRDRLSHTFLLQRDELHQQAKSGDDSIPTTEDRVKKWTFSTLYQTNGDSLTPKHRFVQFFAPYLLVNTAINLQSTFLAKRSRKADIFTLGSITSGSTVTGYAFTKNIEAREPGLTFAAGMAISGAAASANMGSATMPALTFSMAALNIRLGYWLPNPKQLKAWDNRLSRVIQNRMGLYWFGRELFGQIKEDTPRVHLTDGGHIENLGLYELTKRRCRFIIVIDAEADANMNFSSLIKAELMMRIDHGVRIQLPWPKIAAAHKEASQSMAEGQTQNLPGKHGPHVAIGRIVYKEAEHGDPGVYGVLIYIKSSLTGDENDGIRSYKVRYPDFPHESTIDQFFSEEQFEMYRALGFHMAQRAFTGRDRAEFYDPGNVPDRAQFHAEVKAALLKIGVKTDFVDAILMQAWT